MTLIFTIKLEDRILMVSDSAVIDSNNIRTLAAPKIFKLENGTEPVYVGVAGDFACRTSVTECFRDLRALHPDSETIPWFTILAALESLVSVLSEEGEDEGLECQFLIARSNETFLLTPAGVMSFLDPDFICIGSGSEYAEGALRMCDKLNVEWDDPETPKAMIEHVCEAVADMCPSVRGPFTTVEIP